MPRTVDLRGMSMEDQKKLNRVLYDRSDENRISEDSDAHIPLDRNRMPAPIECKTYVDDLCGCPFYQWVDWRNRI